MIPYSVLITVLRTDTRFTRGHAYAGYSASPVLRINLLFTSIGVTISLAYLPLVSLVSFRANPLSSS